MIPYGRQQVTKEDVDAVIAVLRSDYLTQGPTVPRFERAVAARVGARHGIAVNSATSALHLACLALELGPSDVLWTVPNTFVASANCARYCGADVDFVDIDADTWNISVERLREKLIAARRSGRVPKVLVPVHFAGQPPEQERIWELAQEFGFRVLEDASHAIGAVRAGEPVGSCRWADIAVFSFHPVKIITTGEGGMALTNNDELADRMSSLRTHGITRDERKFSVPAPGPWYYEQQSLGYNYRMTDVQAALGESQLKRLESIVEHRNALAKTYNVALQDLPLRLPTVQPVNRSAFHLYVVRLPAGLADQHTAVFAELRSRGIGVNLHYLPVHLQPYYRELGFEPGYCPESERHGTEALTLPLYPGLSESEQRRVTDALTTCLKHALSSA